MTETVFLGTRAFFNRRIESELAGKVSPRVIRAFKALDRASFRPLGVTADRQDMYSVKGGASIIQLREITDGSSMSEPILIGEMIDALSLDQKLAKSKTTGQAVRVLEIGTASGYTAALLSQMAQDGERIHVDTTELARKTSLVRHAQTALLPYSNVDFHPVNADQLGLPGKEFDGILVTAGARDIPEQLLSQLAVGGKMVLPLQENLVVITRQQGKGEKQYLFDVINSVQFHPLEVAEPRGVLQHMMNDVVHLRRWEQTNLSADIVGAIIGYVHDYYGTTDVHERQKIALQWESYIQRLVEVSQTRRTTAHSNFESIP